MIVNNRHAAVAQSVERRIGSAEVTGPIPVSSLEKSLVSKGFFAADFGRIPINFRDQGILLLHQGKE